MVAEYPAITGWSKQERSALVQEHRELLAALLHQAFSSLAERYGEQGLLDAFRFETLDDAVDWCLERFATGDLDPGKVSPPLRTWRLFTVPGFWLAQREGRAGYLRKIATLKAAGERATEHSPDLEHQGELQDQADAPGALDIKRLIEGWADTLRKLLNCTCPSLVIWWLRATEGLRAGWFDLPIPDLTMEPVSKKTRSVLAHDALLRFQGLHRALVQEGDSVGLAHLAVREWLFRPCRDVPPYRRSEKEIAEELPEVAPRDERTIQKLRRQGVEALIFKLVDEAGRIPSQEEPVALAEWQLLRQSLTKTTLVAFKLDEGSRPELDQRISGLAEIELKSRSVP